MPMLDAPPTVAPIAPLPARDESLIAQLTGPRPVAPTIQPDSRLQQIARALMAFSAGVQGQGPQFLAQLDEQRQRPQREFQAATEQFEDRRRRAIGVAESKRQGEQADIQRRADIQSGREFQMFEMEQRDRMQEARDLRLQAAALEREEVKAKAEIAEQQRKEKAQQDRDARLIARDFGKVGAPPAVAKNLGDYYAGLTDKLSSEAAKFESAQARLAEIRANRAASGGTGGGATGASDKAVEAIRQFEAIKQKLIEAVAVGNARAQEQLMLDLNRAFRGLARFPEIEAGFDASGKWPYAKLRTPQGSLGLAQQQQAPSAPAPAATPQGQQKDPLGIR
jgi:hypothetical protein